MKRLITPMLFSLIALLCFSCGNVQKLGGYRINEKDATSAIRQLLEIGAKSNELSSAYSKEAVMSAIFPEPVKKVINTVQQLGLSNQIDRFTTTLSTASQKSATASVPIFVDAINHIKFNDAIYIIKNGGTSATDYLRSVAGDSLRHAITPIMQNAINEYHLNEQWNDIIKPAKVVAGNKLNLDLANIMAGVVSESMFQKMAEKEKEVRSNASARTTPLLQKVFSISYQ